MKKNVGVSLWYVVIAFLLLSAVRRGWGSDEGTMFMLLHDQGSGASLFSFRALASCNDICIAVGLLRQGARSWVGVWVCLNEMFVALLYAYTGVEAVLALGPGCGALGMPWSSGYTGMALLLVLIGFMLHD